MYVITGKTDNVVIGIGESLDHMSNGYPRLVNENIAFVTEQVNVNEVESVPKGNITNEYCYTAERGFYLNPNWKEPEKYYTLDEAANILVQEVNA